jgi:glucokinase
MSGSSPVLALDLGASRVRAAVVLTDGTVVSRAEAPTRGSAGPDAVTADAVELLVRVRDTAPADVAAAIEAIGISAVGPLDLHTGRLHQPPNMPRTFSDVPFAEPIGAALGLPWAIDRDTRHFLYLTVSTGLGGAIVSDGRLVAGPDGVGGELGHLTLQLDGPLCGCGARGHLEAISSGSGIARAAADAIEAGRAPGLQAIRDALAPAALTARDVAAAGDAGDPDAAAIMDRARAGFAAAAVSLVDMFAPELIVVGGSIARARGEDWLEPARAAVRELSFGIAARRVRIVEAALGDDVSLIGAVPLVASRTAG